MRRQAVTSAAESNAKSKAEVQKEKLFGLIGNKGYVETVLADPDTKQPVRVVTSGVWLGGESGAQKTKINLIAGNTTYRGSADTYLNLLEAVGTRVEEDQIRNDDSQQNALMKETAKRLLPFIPPPLRSPLATAGFPVGEDYIPMRDLFTSPTVSFAYERGWRQGFQRAGFPGPDREAEMASEYFAPAIVNTEGSSTLVDMSCATGKVIQGEEFFPNNKFFIANYLSFQNMEGLFTRRFAKSGKYDRVLGCDYSDSMLLEARRRIRGDPSLSPGRRKTRLDLVRLDVGRIPMQTSSVDVLHAGAAMHCWPELVKAVTEIYRVLKPGGRYFATTFLSSYFSTLQSAEGGANGPSRQAFQYFESTDQLRSLMEQGGFSPDKISIEVLQPAAVVIRCEK